MSKKLPVISGKKLISFLSSLNYKVIRQRGVKWMPHVIIRSMGNQLVFITLKMNLNQVEGIIEPNHHYQTKKNAWKG